MKRIILLALLLIAFLAGTAKVLFFPPGVANAAPQVNFGECVSSVPADWGAFRGGSEQSGLSFEDRQGTLRFVTNIPCNGAVPQIALEIRRTNPKN
jgi:hypothetical protein